LLPNFVYSSIYHSSTSYESGGIQSIVFNYSERASVVEGSSTTPTLEQTQNSSTSFPAGKLEAKLENTSATDPYPKGKEVKSLRTETAKVYENSDGSYTAEVFLEPIYFKQNGQWVDIDNTLIENLQQERENKSNKFKVKFPEKPKQNERAKLFTYEIEGHQVIIEFSTNLMPSQKFTTERRMCWEHS
jgi:hypothetical protein